MRKGLALLTVAYTFSQFFRAFLAVLSEPLARDLGAAPQDLSTASGLWFLAFAAMQIPVGAALDRIGPRRTAAVLFGIGGAGGSALFAMATTPAHVSAAMLLLGIGCSPVLMASYYIFARSYPPAMFATLGAVVLGLGSLGNLLGAAPLAQMAEAIGWRASLWSIAGASALIAVGLWWLVTDPPAPEGDRRGSFLDLLRIPALWPVIPLMLVSYAPAAALRGLWIGPYLADVHGADAAAIGNAAMVMGIAMIVGTFAYGPLDRLLGTRKWVALAGNAAGAAACLALWAMPGAGWALAVGLFAAVGVFGGAYPLLIAHGRSFAPPHLAGRAVTLMNLFGIATVGLFQLVSGPLQAKAAAHAASPAGAYAPIFLVLGLLLAAACLVYAFSEDRLD